MDEKKLSEEVLEEVDGGRLNLVKKSLLAELPAGLADKLANAVSDVQVSKILADNGIDVEAFEKKVENLGLPIKKIGLSEESLDKVMGGFSDSDYKYSVVCQCGNDNRDEFSRQFWASLLGSFKSVYRCKKCGNYVAIQNDHNIAYFDKEDLVEVIYGL